MFHLPIHLIRQCLFIIFVCGCCIMTVHLLHYILFSLLKLYICTFHSLWQFKGRIKWTMSFPHNVHLLTVLVVIQIKLQNFSFIPQPYPHLRWSCMYVLHTHTHTHTHISVFYSRFNSDFAFWGYSSHSYQLINFSVIQNFHSVSYKYFPCTVSWACLKSMNY